MRFHVVGLPFSETLRDEFSWDAFEMKVRKFADMMTSLGHEVYLYAGDRNDADCTEHVSCISREEQESFFGAMVVNKIPVFDSESPGWRLFNERVTAAIRARGSAGDYICVIGGHSQAAITEAFPDMYAVEFGIGYEGCYAPYKVFESYAWMHAVYAWQQGSPGSADGRFFDAVIPNYYDLAEYEVGDGKGGYLLYVGRIIKRKGLEVAIETARRVGMPLIAAGPPGDITLPPDVEYVGVVEPKQRSELMGRAHAVLMPTLYIEPFGGVAVESQLCGTPVITTDWGAFPETVLQGKTGFRCRALSEFVRAVESAPELDRQDVRNSAADRYDMQHVRFQYQSFFTRLETLKGEGWYAIS